MVPLGKGVIEVTRRSDPVELYEPQASNPLMRRHSFHAVLLLLAWCIGFQPVAQAMGARCAHSSATAKAALAVGSPDEHAMHRMHAVSGHEGHTQMAAQMSEKGEKTAGGRCQCGCNCAMPGCVGSAPGIATLTSMRSFGDSSGHFRSHEMASHLRAAHGLDLIRPPSTS